MGYFERCLKYMAEEGPQMLSKGYDTEYFIIMHKRTGLKMTTKGVVYPFLTPGGPTF